MLIVPLPADKANNHAARRFNNAFTAGDIFVYDTELMSVEIPKHARGFRKFGAQFSIYSYELKSFKDMGAVPCSM